MKVLRIDPVKRKLMNTTLTTYHSDHGAYTVKGKAVNQGHQRTAGVSQESEVPIVSIDYAFVNEDGEYRKKRKERENRGEETGERERERAETCR